MNTESQRIAIIGGGWAGLAAAVELCKQKHQVTLFESSPQLGGRARSIEWNDMNLDNGQHLMIGAYQQMLALLHSINADIDALFTRLPHHLLMLDAKSGKPVFDLQLPGLPAPLHLLLGVLKTPYLTLLEKMQVLIRFNRLLNTPLTDDLSVSEWLANAHLPQKYIKNILEPVCLAALTTQPHQASAKAFQSVLQQTFNAPAEHTNLLIPSTDLGRVFPELAKQFILKQGGHVLPRHKVKNLDVDKLHVKTLTVNDQQLEFEQVILATAPSSTRKLLQDIIPAQQTCEQLDQLLFEPVTTLYLQFAQTVHLPTVMTGVVNGLAEWVFERASSGHPDVLAVVISAQGAHSHLTKEDLLNQVLDELKQIVPTLPQLLDSKLIIEKRATFQCHPNVDKHRPGISTNLDNLHLCGDYVYIEENNQPGLPSTLEGAMRSGVKCAQTVMNLINH